MNQPAHKTEGVIRTKRVWFYPFVFTGKEKDEETGYGYFGARYMDHELMTGWLSVDPLADKYPSISPYAYCTWNPVRLTDPSGDSICYQLGDVKYYYTLTENGYAWIDKEGNKYSGDNKLFKEVTDALGKLQEKPIGKKLVDRLLEDNRTVEIACSGSNGSDAEAGEWVRWNPYKTKGNFLNEDGTRERPSFIGLAHELAHINEVWHGENNQSEWFKDPINGNTVPRCEIPVCDVENEIRVEHNISRRAYYFYFEDEKRSYKYGPLLNK